MQDAHEGRSSLDPSFLATIASAAGGSGSGHAPALPPSPPTAPRAGNSPSGGAGTRDRSEPQTPGTYLRPPPTAAPASRCRGAGGFQPERQPGPGRFSRWSRPRRRRRFLANPFKARVTPTAEARPRRPGLGGTAGPGGFRISALDNSSEIRFRALDSRGRSASGSTTPSAPR